MARPHHRKKHKEHLRQFQQRAAGKTGESKEKASAATVFAVTGAVVGIAVLFFATGGDYIWAIGGGVIGGVIGYLVGKSWDKAPKK
jgi:hypothetical protein